VDNSGENRAGLILASGSRGRAAILHAAGIAFTQVPAEIDERALEREAMEAGEGIAGPELARMLAIAKAEHVSKLYPDTHVIGADQVMSCGTAIFHKPPTVEKARDQLLQLRGKTHLLSAGICVARGGRAVWQHLDQAHMTMREFTNAFLEEYLRLEDMDVLQSVGCYRIEARGIQLFSAVKGDYFTIVGLPLLPLLGYLRDHGLVVR
jgi:septum formation protein